MNCWFCSVIEEDKKKALHLKLYGEVGAQETAELVTHVKYVVHEVDIPRCALCKSKHKEAFFFKLLCLLFLVLSIIASVLTAFEVISNLPAGIIIGLTFGFAVGAFFYSYALHKGIQSVISGKRSYPVVQELLEKGYKFGKGIKDHTNEVPTKTKEDEIGEIEE